jgi:hypothetical protein
MPLWKITSDEHNVLFCTGDTIEDAIAKWNRSPLADQTESITRVSMVCNNNQIISDTNKRIVPTTVDVAWDNRCTCTCATTCVLGKVGLQERCTDKELIAAGIAIKRVS